MRVLTTWLLSCMSELYFCLTKLMSFCEEMAGLVDGGKAVPVFCLGFSKASTPVRSSQVS